MSTYVISDIHGEYDKFIEMLNTIKFGKDDKLYVLGDMVDRGSKSMEVVQHVMISPNMEAIMGNHEEMLIYAVTQYGITGSYPTTMLSGTDTQKSYKALRKLWYKDRSIAGAVIQYLKKLPLHKKIEVNGKEYLLVHAGIKNVELEKNTTDDFLWIREEFYQSKKEYPFTVIFGHTPTYFIHGKTQIYKGSSIIGIDCGGTFENGLMGCLRLDDLKEYYI